MEPEGVEFLRAGVKGVDAVTLMIEQQVLLTTELWLQPWFTTHYLLLVFFLNSIKENQFIPS